MFEMHGLVLLSTRKWLESCGLQEKFKQRFVAQMATLFPTGDHSHWATCQRLFAHVEIAINYRPADSIMGFVMRGYKAGMIWQSE